MTWTRYVCSIPLVSTRKIPSRSRRGIRIRFNFQCTHYSVSSVAFCSKCALVWNRRKQRERSSKRLGWTRRLARLAFCEFCEFLWLPRKFTRTTNLRSKVWDHVLVRWPSTGDTGICWNAMSMRLKTVWQTFITRHGQMSIWILSVCLQRPFSAFQAWRG